MRRFPSLSAALAALLIAITPSLSFSFERKTPIVEAVNKTKESIVTIKTARANGSREISGTGVIVEPRGLIVTNKHVVGAGRGVTVCLNDGTELNADVLMSEARYDLAVLRIKAGRPLPFLRLAPTADLMVGEDVIAIGHPFGYVNTVSKGIISALDREIPLPSGEVLTGLIQTDASINPGNSGGPLLNINGELIGLNVALREGAQGIAFAINAGTVEQVLAKHFDAFRVSGIQHGLKIEEKIVHQFEAARERRLALAEGIGALKSGDVIVMVGTNEVQSRFDLERSFWGKKAGESVEVMVKRQGQSTTVSLTVAAGQAAGEVVTVSPRVAVPTVTPSVPVSIEGN